METKVEELRRFARTLETESEDARLLDELVIAARAEGAEKTMEKVRRSIVIRYYPVGFHGDTLEPLQCVSTSVLDFKK